MYIPNESFKFQKVSSLAFAELKFSFAELKVQKMSYHF